MADNRQSVIIGYQSLGNSIEYGYERACIGVYSFFFEKRSSGVPLEKLVRLKL